MESIQNYFKDRLQDIQDIIYQDEKKYKKEIKLLIIGKTGAGKSTLINMLINQALNIKYDEERTIAISQQVTIRNKFDQNLKSLTLDCNLEKFINKQSDLQKDQSKSQTQQCNIYSVETKDYILKLIDTPGLGDTKGTDQDEINVRKIISEVSKLDQINGIIYVHKATDQRYDAYVKYYIQETKAMLTKECQKNFVVCFTNVINQQRLDAYPVLEKQGIITQDNYFQFENDCLVPPSFYTQRDENQIRLSKVYWDENRVNYQKLIEKVAQLPPQSTKPLVELHLDKEVMKQLIFDKYHQIKKLTDQEIVLKQQINEYKQKEKQIEEMKPQLNKEVTVFESYFQDQTENITEKVPVDPPGKLTTCLLCQTLCHDPCYLKEVFDKGNYNLKNCHAFCGQENCNYCNHHYTEHSHSCFKFQKKQVVRKKLALRPVKKLVTDKNIQQIIQQQESNKNQIKQEIQNTFNDLKIQNKIIEQEMRIISYLYQRIKNISQDPIHDALLEYLQQQIQNIKKDPTLTSQQAQEQIHNLQNKYDQYQKIKELFEKNSQDVALTQDELELLNKQIEQQQQQLQNYQLDIKDYYEKYRGSTTVSQKDIKKQQSLSAQKVYLLDQGKLGDKDQEKLLDNTYSFYYGSNPHQKRITYRFGLFQSADNKYSQMLTYQFNNFYLYWTKFGDNSFRLFYKSPSINFVNKWKLNIFGDYQYNSYFNKTKVGMNIFSQSQQLQTKLHYFNKNNIQLTQKFFSCFNKNYFLDSSINLQILPLVFNKFNTKIGFQDDTKKIFLNYQILEKDDQYQQSQNLFNNYFQRSCITLNGEFNIRKQWKIGGKIQLNNNWFKEQTSTSTNQQETQQNQQLNWIVGSSYEFNDKITLSAKLNNHSKFIVGSTFNLGKLAVQLDYQVYNKQNGFNILKNPLGFKIDYNY